MRDSKLTEVKEICKKHTHCEECEFFNEEEGCVFNSGYYPTTWGIDEEQDPKDNPENYKEINDKLC